MENKFLVRNGLTSKGDSVFSGSINVIAGITGSLFGTSSQAIFASSSLNAQDILTFVKNSTGATITKGKVVRITGAQGDNALISLADSSTENTSANTLGFVTADILDGENGYVMTTGKFLGINTNDFIPGTLLYLGTSGSITSTAPTASSHSVRLGQVLRQQTNNGSIDVRIDNGYELNELHDVLITSASNGDLLMRRNGTWVNINQSSFITTSSLGNTQTITGSLVISQSLTVLGNTTITTVTASNLDIGTNIVSVFANSPAILTGGYKVVDSASLSSSSSLLYDVSQSRWTIDKPLSGSFSGSLFGTATTASYVNNLSQSVKITGSVDISGSQTISGSLNITGSQTISGSVSITGSLLINGKPVGDATVLVSGSAPSGSASSGSLWWNTEDGNLYIQSTILSGSTWVPATNTVAGGNYGATFRNTYSASVWTVNHNLNTTSPLINVYSGSQVMIPASIVSTSPNISTITFAGIVSGSVVASTGIGGPTSSSFALSSVSSVSASYASSSTSASYALSSSFTSTASILTGTTGSDLWVWSMGNPTGFGWTMTGNAFYSNAPHDGAVLTTAVNNQSGNIFRSKSTSYFTTEEFILSANTRVSGSGGGADGIALFVGNASTTTGQYEGITVFIDEYNSAGSVDAIKIWKSGTLLANVDPTAYIASGIALDDNKVRKWEMIVEGPQTSRWVTFTMNDIILWRGNVGSWTPSGGFYGAWAFTGGAVNRHCIPAIGLRPAKMWKMNQGLI
jgi:hypothetical protein